MQCIRLLAAALVCAAAASGQQAAREVQAAIEALFAEATTPAARGQACQTVVEAGFAQVGLPLVRALEAYRTRPGYQMLTDGIGPWTQMPWSETRLSLQQRIEYTVRHAWQQLACGAEWPQAMRTVLAVLEDERGGASREWVMFSFLPQYVGVLRDASAVVPDVYERFERIATTDKDTSIRARACLILLHEVEAPERLVDLAFQLAGTAPQPAQQSELLRNTGVLLAYGRLPRSAQRTVLARSFALLGKLNDGKGTGYFLALELGTALGIAPVAPNSVPFAPDFHSPQYEEAFQRKPAWYQATVDNALAWYAKHKDD